MWYLNVVTDLSLHNGFSQHQLTLNVSQTFLLSLSASACLVCISSYSLNFPLALFLTAFTKISFFCCHVKLFPRSMSLSQCCLWIRLEPDLFIYQFFFITHGVINSQVLKIIKEMFALYTCELLKEGSRKPGVLCICRIIFDEKYAIDTEFVPAGILSHVSPVSWPRPR